MQILMVLFISLLAGCATSSGPVDTVPQPENFNSDGEYRPVDDMTQTEIREELEEMLEDSFSE